MSATAESKTKFQVTSLDEMEPAPQVEGRLRKHVRNELGILGFGINAYGATKAEVPVIREHDESSPWSNGHEELYVVVSGHATFAVDAEEIDAPAGTLVFVADRNTTRGAIATKKGTRVLAIGGTPGEAYRISAGEAAGDWYAHYEAKEYEEGARDPRVDARRLPRGPVSLYNIACCESLLGRRDEALGHLKLALDAHEPFVELARDDRDLDPIARTRASGSSSRRAAAL